MKANFHRGHSGHVPSLPAFKICGDTSRLQRFSERRLCLFFVQRAVDTCPVSLPGRLSPPPKLRRPAVRSLKPAAAMTAGHLRCSEHCGHPAPETAGWPERFSCPRRPWRRRPPAELRQPCLQVCVTSGTGVPYQKGLVRQPSWPAPCSIPLPLSPFSLTVRLALH